MVRPLRFYCSTKVDFAVSRTNGSVIFASGSPYKPTEYNGKRYEPGQGNNMYIFPGIGLGTILSKANHVTDSMVEQASIALASSLTAEEQAAGLVYPRLVRIRDISAQIALAVIRAAQKDVSVAYLLLFRVLTALCTFRTWMRTPYSATSPMTPFWNTSEPSNGNLRLRTSRACSCSFITSLSFSATRSIALLPRSCTTRVCSFHIRLV